MEVIDTYPEVANIILILAQCLYYWAYQSLNILLGLIIMYVVRYVIIIPIDNGVKLIFGRI